MPAAQSPNQVLRCRRLYSAGQLEIEAPTNSLVSVQITKTVERLQHQSHSRREVRKSITGTIDIDLGYARVRIVGRAGLRAGRTGGAGSVIALPAGTRIWIAAGVTDMRKEFPGDEGNDFAAILLFAQAP